MFGASSCWMWQLSAPPSPSISIAPFLAWPAIWTDPALPGSSLSAWPLCSVSQASLQAELTGPSAFSREAPYFLLRGSQIKINKRQAIPFLFYDFFLLRLLFFLYCSYSCFFFTFLERGVGVGKERVIYIYKYISFLLSGIHFVACLMGIKDPCFLQLK